MRTHAVRTGEGRPGWASAVLHPGAWLMALAIVALDQALKAWALAALADGRSAVPLVQGLLVLRLTSSTGVVLGVLSGLPADLVFVLAVTALLLQMGVARTGQLLEIRVVRDLAVGLVAGGGMGDLIDRVRLGDVVDFVDLHVGDRLALAGVQRGGFGDQCRGTPPGGGDPAARVASEGLASGYVLNRLISLATCPAPGTAGWRRPEVGDRLARESRCWRVPSGTPSSSGLKGWHSQQFLDRLLPRIYAAWAKPKSLS